MKAVRFTITATATARGIGIIFLMLTDKPAGVASEIIVEDEVKSDEISTIDEIKSIRHKGGLATQNKS